MGEGGGGGFIAQSLRFCRSLVRHYFFSFSRLSHDYLHPAHHYRHEVGLFILPTGYRRDGMA